MCAILSVAPSLAQATKNEFSRHLLDTCLHFDMQGSHTELLGIPDGGYARLVAAQVRDKEGGIKSGTTARSSASLTRDNSLESLDSLGVTGLTPKFRPTP